ncbi:unnamed protein product [Urochloa humidicola]
MVFIPLGFDFRVGDFVAGGGSVVLLLLSCERVGGICIPAGLLVYVAVVAGNGRLLFRSPASSPAVADLSFFSGSWRMGGRCSFNESDARWWSPGVDSCGNSNFWNPALWRETKLACCWTASPAAGSVVLDVKRLEAEVACCNFQFFQGLCCKRLGMYCASTVA